MAISRPGRRPCSRLAAVAILVVSLGWGIPSASHAGNAGPLPAESAAPFAAERLGRFHYPWALAFLPDGRLLLTERGGTMHLVAQDGQHQPIGGVPTVYAHGQAGLHDVVPSPDFDDDRLVYFTYVEPAFQGGGALVLARARLAESARGPQLQDLQLLWRQNRPGRKGHPGARVAFSPDGRHLFLTVGERQESDTAQDPDLGRGKVLRFNRDGSVPADNPMADAPGVRALTWTTGHRNPYGLAFAPNGDLWLHEMGPRGGDELNRIEPGKNYGWPIVSNGDHYSGLPMARHATRPEFQAPALYWTPVIAPAGMAFYAGPLFPDWQGTALIGGLIAQGLVRVAVDGEGGARQLDRWSLGERIRDVAIAPDGAIWVIEDGAAGGLLRLTPRRAAR
ncbi:PQQ-dependent sugar dehydrogenase [Castellaniella sp.]|uniref:PQQ-dependent sugar dehydrogenase n=1 Tax=Castellaniella sp. TaxID=1955812 RepID=UPI00356B48BB